MPEDQRQTDRQQRQQSLHYTIRVRGPIGPTMLQAFPTLTARRRGRDTWLTGSLADCSALYGAIHQLEALGLELLEVRRRRQSLEPEQGGIAPGK